MPMCQSPKVADILLRARSLPANDNRVRAETGKKARSSKSASKAAWPTAIVLLCVSVLLFLTGVPG